MCWFFEPPCVRRSLFSLARTMMSVAEPASSRLSITLFSNSWLPLPRLLSSLGLTRNDNHSSFHPRTTMTTEELEYRHQRQTSATTITRKNIEKYYLFVYLQLGNVIAFECRKRRLPHPRILLSICTGGDIEWKNAMPVIKSRDST